MDNGKLHSIDDFRGACAVKGNVQVAGHVKRVNNGDAFNQSRISRAERLFKYDDICSQVAGCNSNKQNDPIDDALRGRHALASLPAGI